jgi:hypothetical protein
MCAFGQDIYMYVRMCVVGIYMYLYVHVCVCMYGSL